jgi:hypothetical protein
VTPEKYEPVAMDFSLVELMQGEYYAIVFSS